VIPTRHLRIIRNQLGERYLTSISRSKRIISRILTFQELLQLDLVKPINNIEIASGEEPDLIVTTAGVNRGYAASLKTLRRFSNTIALKGGFKVPRPLMANPDLNRVINSDEIQSVVKPPKRNNARAPLKKNPLNNLGAMLKLNPYAKARAAPRRLVASRGRTVECAGST
jgi:hypothetical protein